MFLQYFADVAVKFQTTSYTVSSQYNNSVEICVKSTSKGTSEEFLIIAETDSTKSEVLTISRSVIKLYYICRFNIPLTKSLKTLLCG